MKISKYDSLKADIFDRALVIPLEELPEMASDDENPLIKLMAIEALRAEGRVIEADLAEDEYLH